jgi:hypothetical protein
MSALDANILKNLQSSEQHLIYVFNDRSKIQPNYVQLNFEPEIMVRLAIRGFFASPDLLEFKLDKPDGEKFLP